MVSNVLFVCFSSHVYSASASSAPSGTCAAEIAAPPLPTQEGQQKLVSGSSATCANEPSELGSLLQHQFTDFTESRASSADLLYITGMGMDLSANLSPQPWELIELHGAELLGNIGNSEDISSVRRAFDAITRTMNLKRKYNAKELDTFKSHFAQAVVHDTMALEQKMGAGKLSMADRKNLIKKHMMLQQPVTTEKIVKDINRRKLGWVAGITSTISNLTLRDFKSLTGYIKSDDDRIDSKFAAAEIDFLQSDPPPHFDARDAWPECADIISHISDQGKCASCWALTTVGVLRDRLCVSSGGVFNKHLSAGDMLACSELNYGCKGGSPASAVDFLREHGTVTGSHHEHVGWGTSCFPYPIAGIDSTKHFDVQVETPECRDSCPETAYPREYSKDKYFAGGGTYMIGSYFPHESADKTEGTWDALKRAISTKGSVMMMYSADRSHLSYQSGFWDCPAGQPNHMARCIAYGVDFKQGKYITCMQSWGKAWGEEGRFRMKFPGNGCLEMFQVFPVSWVGKNQETGVPPDPVSTIWSAIGSWFNSFGFHDDNDEQEDKESKSSMWFPNPFKNWR
jgi:cathepsin B